MWLSITCPSWGLEVALIIIKCDPKGGDIDHSTIVQCIAQILKLTTMSIIIVLPFVCIKTRAFAWKTGNNMHFAVSRNSALSVRHSNDVIYYI